jgi:hypothetical protein
MTLLELKAIRYDEIAQVNEYLLLQGFVFDTVTFSMDQVNQIYYDEILRMGAPAFPLLVRGISNDNEVYSLDINDRASFCANFLVSKVAIIQSGNDLCQQIWNAVNEAAVDAIVDTRI